jgi:hypothetical protein
MALPYRAPAGTMLGGKNIGGRWMSAPQGAVAKFPGAAAPPAGVHTVTGPGMAYYTRLPLINAAIRIRCHAASRETAEDILADAIDFAPIGDRGYEDEDSARIGHAHPGTLKASLQLEELDETGDWAVISEASYAAFVEFGTVRNAAQPYLVPAVEKHTGGHIARTTAALQGL